MKTGTFTVDNVGNADAVITDCDCHEVEIYENTQAGTTDYDVYAPSLTDTPVRVPAGARRVFRQHGGGIYLKGATVGYVAAVTAGTYTFCKEQR